ncbi:MAG TPA: HD domain-containing protein, partial [Actinomycetota bacterium]
MREVAAGLGPKVALVALGGYGRAALCPGSDLDLMVLHARRRGIKTSAEAVFYPFWDAGFTVGHAVRTVRESVFAAREHLEAATALLDARLVWGDEDLFARMDAEVRATLRADAAGFLDRLRADARARGEAHGSAAHLLEPHLKESRGALRDVHAVGWALAGAGLEPEPDLLRPGEAAALADAEEFLVRLRSALHLESGRRRDRLVMEDQPGMARAFGYEATAGLDAPDALMRSLFEHARQVEHISASVLDRVERRLGGAPDVPPSPGPRGIVEVLTAAAGLDPIPAWLLDAAEAAAPPDPWTPAVRDAFLGLLASRPAALEALDRTGVLTALLPEWSAVRCRPQRDPYHRFTVDVHLLRTVEAAAAILDRGSEDPVLAAAAGAVHDRDAVLLGALLHDIGKRGQGDHVPVGVEVAGAVVERMGVGEPTAGHVRFLVGEHLLLADTATRRDLTDENPVVDVAARVETPERLAMLAVLTAADAASTGSHAWTPWRQALVRELVGKVQRVLDR